MVDPSFHTGQMSKLFLIINRMVRISIVSGLGRSSGVAFALYGFSLSSDDGNRKENYRYGKLAVILQEKLMAREYDCRVLTYVYVLLNHWQEPLQKSLTPLLSAHSAGMEKGDIDYAFQAAGAYLTLYWYSGVSVHFVINCNHCDLFSLLIDD
jgi:predicted ATPase